ncbi:MAG: hypothetical protein GY822_14165 [Deltaproteobacteria bacterium]|nr:hypothetical protein [Deltaproteobacteria bacterium]
MASRGIPRGEITQAAKPPSGKERRGSKDDKGKKDDAKPIKERRNAARKVAMNATRDLSAKLQGAALVKKMGESVKLEIVLPELTSLDVQVAEPEPISEDEIDIYLANLKLSAYEVQPKAKGARLEMGDQILVDSKGYCRGAVFSAQVNSWLVMQENPLVPTLFENLVGLPVGDSTVVSLMLPEDYPDPDFAGETAAFAVLVKEAVEPPGRSMPDIDLLQDLGYGDTLEEGRAALRAELEEALATQMVQSIREEVMGLLEDQAKVDITDEHIDIELEKAWRKAEGESLALSGVSLEEQEYSLKDFLKLDERRAGARSLLWQRALVEKLAEKLPEEEDELKTLLGNAAEAAGIDLNLVQGALNKLAGEKKELVQGLKLQRALDQIMEKVNITFVPADEIEDDDEA